MMKAENDVHIRIENACGGWFINDNMSNFVNYGIGWQHKQWENNYLIPGVS